MPLGIFSNKHLELVCTKYEVKRSIIKDGRCIQPFLAQNPVFNTLTRENLNKTLVQNDNPKFSYRNNENYEIHHGLFSNKHVELVYTKYEVKRSITRYTLQGRGAKLELLRSSGSGAVHCKVHHNLSFVTSVSP